MNVKLGDNKMTESILESTKQRLGIPEGVTNFDAEIVPLINLSINTLFQLGLGPSDSYKITGPIETWHDYIGDDKRLEMVKDYIFMKVKLLWDSNTMTGAVIEVYKAQIKELESRISYQVDPWTTFD